MLASGCAEVEVPVPADVALGAMRDEHTQPFTGPIRLTELRDGRVLALDVREQRLVLVDFTTHAEEPVGSRGDGPLEYRSGYRFARAVGDSIWMFDIVRGRILVFTPEGVPVRSFDITSDGSSSDRVSAPWLESVASNGDWYGRTRGLLMPSTRTGQPGGFSDSTAIVRVSASGDRVDTVASAGTRRALKTSTLGGRQFLSSFDAVDAYAVFRDGQVLVVRGATYSPEIVHLDGSVQRAPLVVHQRVTLNAAEIRVMLDSMERMTLASVANVLRQMPGGAAEMPRMELEIAEPRPTTWPVLMTEGSIPVDRQDRAWVAVRDSSLTTKGQRYDLLDREGRWVSAVRLPLGSVLVGFGESSLYVARRDCDDLLWLGRYPLPE